MRTMKEDPETARLSDRQRALVRYAVQLTRAPESMAREDVERLRDVGLEDSEILDLCQVTAYYAYVNRIAQGLGVELET